MNDNGLPVDRARHVNDGGLEAMAEYSRRYVGEASVDTAELPYWDLFAALRHAGSIDGWALSPSDVARMREQLELFARAAFRTLADP